MNQGTVSAQSRSLGINFNNKGVTIKVTAVVPKINKYTGRETSPNPKARAVSTKENSPIWANPKPTNNAVLRE